MITLDSLDRNEALRYMGGAGISLNESMRALLDRYEELLLKTAKPRYLYKTVDLPNDGLLIGNDVKSHLKGCEKAVLMCATLGAETDRLIRVTQISDMAGAVVLDSLASVAVEQVCSTVDDMVARENPELCLTFRFSPGYGDYPITLQKDFLRLLDAQRKIGLSVSESCMLIPSKSVTAIAGLSQSPIEPKKRGCASCNLRGSCKYRKNGGHCEF